ncbi:DUF3343 domain-containing protein [Desulfothermus naphthae]
MFGRIFKKILKRKEFLTADKGFLVFENTSEVIRAEKVLKDHSIHLKVAGPPAEIQKGCDLVIVFPIVKKLQILRILKSNDIEPIDVVPVNSPLLEPVSLYHKKDFGEYLMVRAANMKITVDKRTLKIVNISGGGCPDVPYLGHKMVGKTLKEAPAPQDIGHTLCAYALQKALEEVIRICSQ